MNSTRRWAASPEKTWLRQLDVSSATLFARLIARPGRWQWDYGGAGDNRRHGPHLLGSPPATRVTPGLSERERIAAFDRSPTQCFSPLLPEGCVFTDAIPPGTHPALPPHQ